MELCCTAMSGATRRHQPKVREEELPDAAIEYDPKFGFALWFQSIGSHSVIIHYCPWCGTNLSTLEP